MNCADIEKYKSEIETGLMNYMSKYPVNERSASAIDSMVECWKHITEMQEMLKEKKSEYPEEDYDFTPEKAEHWLLHMKNEDGTTGGHWNITQTNAYKPQNISDYCWEAALNMIYSDYYSVAVKHGVNTVDFYVDLAKAFLFDKDAKNPKDKMAAYYNYIVNAK